MEQVTLEGIVENIVFTNEDNGYTVCECACGGELVTLVGIMPYLNEGESIKAQGVWQVHATFGRQLKVEYFEKKLPTDSEAIYKYLSSGAVKGIGPVTAARIVEAFGADTFDVMENNPKWLCDIKGISPRRAKEISESYAAQFGMRSVMMFCSRFFGPSVSARIYRRYGAAAVTIIEKDPYRLISDIEGVGFEKADTVAQQLGFPADSPQRIEAGAEYVLSNAAYAGGHCCLPEKDLIAKTAQALNVQPMSVATAIARMCERGELVRANEEYIYLREYREAESYINAKLRLLRDTPRPERYEGVESAIKDLEGKYGITYADEQVQAIVSGITNGVTVITGGPGTGKTTVIKALTELLLSLKISFCLAAPTGRAAKRMSEASGADAKTIHRLLETEFDTAHRPKFGRDEGNPLPASVVIIDEMSMVDLLLFSSLLKAVKRGSTLVLIGDVDQLPPVGAGQCLKDIIESEAFPVVRLKHIFRQAEQSLIVTNAHDINKGNMPVLNAKDNDFFFMERSNYTDIQQLLLSLCRDRLPKTYSLDSFSDIQILTPTRKGELGTKALNAVLQEGLNPKSFKKREKKIGNVLFREGDKVMQTKNNYDIQWDKDGIKGQGIFNGDVGRIISIDTQSETMVIDFDDRVAEYDFALLDELEHAFAVTVHKSQGNEYPVVLMPVYDCPYPLMTRNLFYTAVTRAKKLLILVGKQRCVSIMVENDKKSHRYGHLKQLLSE
ncbi:MAG: ATP-dependent RecD-like DNA helicase [Clostridia bacterium]|nr:ATP-dependent RecD-like DNA helicase [Clostridia bacterium]